MHCYLNREGRSWLNLVGDFLLWPKLEKHPQTREIQIPSNKWLRWVGWISKVVFPKRFRDPWNSEHRSVQWGEGRLNPCLRMFLNTKIGWFCLPRGREQPLEPTQLLLTWELVATEAAERNFRMSRSTARCTGSWGAAQGNERFPGGIPQARAPSRPLPPSCFQIMQRVRMWNHVRDLSTQLPHEVKKELKMSC